ncbi:response regulator [Hymenobacter jeollabukensis]|uniref:Response regulator transcription factor n=1 Tax=Hymenobacter jeollabukensis TaxID=2025313 RepID=A0A5R8WK28_9BACT|nr:response regulator transcription factor [Hymenobacter jeollabukensis]TLM89382.1 response regulator transcription factor [Hymenobacter jeollabukensis]
MSEPLREIIQVLLVDDHPLVIEGISSLLKDLDDVRVVATASSGYEALQRLQEQPALRVAIVDLNMPGMGGVDLIRLMQQQHPAVRAMALSVYFDYSSVTDVLDAGGAGYLLKNTSKKELIEAIRRVYTGQRFFSQEVGDTLLQNMPRPSAPAEVREERPAELTAREKEVLELIADELPNSLIAKKLFISERTVESHRKNLLTKTNSKSVVGLIQYALRHKLID